MKQDDPLGHEISVADELARRGIKGGLNKRAVAAIDRLLGDAVDFLRVPGDGHEGRKGSEEAAKSVEAGGQEIFGPILAAHYREIFAKHENRQAVVMQALDVLKQMANAPDTERGAADPIGDDWLNFFAAYAEKAASENLRQTFGHILSGEIRKPGSFSFSTLRIVSELDPGSASLFQRIASRAFSMDAKDPTPSAVLKPEDLRGPYLHEMLKLEALGLIQEVGGDFAISTSKAEAGAQIWIRFGRLLLRGEMKKKVYFSLQLVKLTDAGAELCSILPMDHQGGAREVGGLMAKRGLEASIHVITGVSKGDVLYRTPGEAVRA
ncbi:DUF2806 domain-containing protein [Taklimakanibacter deserti]|uniref:DUF2806 domain-containing protein n=1 Tax=Taklimakanibacter deserti TaxID=2267839 RepID=UPI000E65914B